MATDKLCRRLIMTWALIIATAASSGIAAGAENTAGQTLLHSTLDGIEAVTKPHQARPGLSGLPIEIVTSGKGSATFEPSPCGLAIRLHGNVQNNELLRINPALFDFSRSGRLDMRINFNRDPHAIEREFYILCGSRWPIAIQLEVLPYTDGESNLALWVGSQERGMERQLYASCGDRYQPGGPWSSVRQGRWHNLTIKWWKRLGKDDAIQLLIDDIAQEKSMTDLTGSLPIGDEAGALLIGGNPYGDYANDISIDELWIFDDPERVPDWSCTAPEEITQGIE